MGEAVTYYFVSELELELSSLRSSCLGAFPTAPLTDGIRCLQGTSSCHKVLQQNCIRASASLGDSVPPPQREQNSPPPSPIGVAITLSSSKFPFTSSAFQAVAVCSWAELGLLCWGQAGERECEGRLQLLCPEHHEEMPHPSLGVGTLEFNAEQEHMGG